MIKTIKTIIDSVLSNRTVSFTDVDKRTYTMDVQEIIFQFGYVPEKMGLYLKGIDLADNKEKEIKMIQGIVLKHNAHLIRELLKSKPLIAINEAITLKTKNQELITTPGFILLQNTDSSETITLVKRIMLDTTSPYLQHYIQQYNRKQISLTTLNEQLIQYSYRINFTYSDYEILTMVYRGYQEFSINYKNKIYITKDKEIPMNDKLSEDEIQMTKEVKQSCTLSSLNINVIIELAVEYSTVRVLGFKKQKLLSGVNLEDKTGLYIFRDTVEEDVFEAFLPKSTKIHNVVIFTSNNTEMGKYKIDNPYVNIIQLEQPNATIRSDNYDLLKKCRNIKDNIDFIIVPEKSSAPLDIIIKLSYFTKVIYLHQYNTVDDLFLNIDKITKKKLFNVLLGIGSIPKSEYITSKKLNILINNRDLLKATSMKSTLDVSVKTEKGIVKKNIDYNKFFDIIYGLLINNNSTNTNSTDNNSTPPLPNIIIEDKIILKDELNNEVVESLFQFDIDQKTLTRLFIELAPNSQVTDDLINMKYSKFIVESEVLNYELNIINNPTYKGNYRIIIIPITQPTQTSILTGGLTIISSLGDKIRLTQFQSYLQSAQNEDIAVIDLLNICPINKILERNNVIKITDESKIQDILTKSSFDIICVNNFEMLSKPNKDLLIDCISNKTKVLISSKYYLPEIIHRYTNDVKLFLKYLKKVVSVIEDTKSFNVIVDELEKDSISQYLTSQAVKTKDDLCEITNTHFRKVIDNNKIHHLSDTVLF